MGYDYLPLSLGAMRLFWLAAVWTRDGGADANVRDMADAARVEAALKQLSRKQLAQQAVARSRLSVDTVYYQYTQ